MRLEHVRAEAQCYLYVCGTVLNFFDDSLTREALAGNDPRSLDRLGSARQVLAVNARLSWLTTGEFRSAWRLPVLETRWLGLLPPSQVLCPFAPASARSQRATLR